MRFRASSVSWRDLILAGAIGTLALLAWWTLWLWGKSPYGHVLMHGPAHLAMAENRWLYGALFIAGWIVMTIAMMLPTSAPLLVMFHRMVRGRRSAIWLIALVVAGYLAVWTLSGTLLNFVNWFLQFAIGRIPISAAASLVAGAVLLAVAGLYQFSSLKYACLDKCRSPMSFLTSRGQGGNESVQSLRIGIEHGIFCVGCCWSLMLLMFVVGAGSLIWMLILGIVMALEKNLPWGRRLSGPLGVVLLVSAVALLVTGLRK
jgi:predicted metal-binding membrane protein